MRQLEVRLQPWEFRRLRELRDHAASARVVKRAMCLLLSASGRRRSDIAGVTGLSPRAVSAIRRRWRRRRLRSLTDKPRCGRPPRVTAEYRRELRLALRKGPRACGLVFTVWSVARLGTYLCQRTDIRVSNDWLRRLMHRAGFVVDRPAHTLKGKRNETEYRAAKRRLERLKKGPANRTHPMNCGTRMPRSSTCCRT